MVTIYGISIVGTPLVYVGKTIQPVQKRWGEHKSRLRHGQHVCLGLQAAWNAGEKLDFYVIEEDAGEDAEYKWIKAFGKHALNTQNPNFKIPRDKTKYHVSVLNTAGELVWDGWGIKPASKTLGVTHEGVLRYINGKEGRGWNQKYKVWVTRTSSIVDYNDWSAPIDTRKRCMGELSPGG